VIEIAAGDLSKWWGYRKEQDMGLTLSWDAQQTKHNILDIKECYKILKSKQSQVIGSNQQLFSMGYSWKLPMRNSAHNGSLGNTKPGTQRFKGSIFRKMEQIINSMCQGSGVEISSR
jgi:hypothetical protein